MPRPLLLLFLSLIAVLLGAAPTRSQGAGVPETVVPASRAWAGKWIWIAGESKPRNSYTYFRKTLKLDSVPKEAKVHLTADSRYQLFINGKFVGRGPVRSDRRWLYYDTWDVAPELKRGENVVAVLVHHIGETTFQYMQGRGGLLLDMVGPAARDLAHTGADWKALRSAAWSSAGPRMSIQLGFNETFDATKEPPGWKDAPHRDDAWPNAVELGAAGMGPWPHLVQRDIPKMRERPAYATRVLKTDEVGDPGQKPDSPVSLQMAKAPHGPLDQVQVSAPDKVIIATEAPLDPSGFTPDDPTKPPMPILPAVTFTRVKTAPGKGASFLIDFGREVTGFPRFRVRGAKGGETVDMGYGEVLQDPAGAFIPQSSDKIGRLNPDRDGVHYADRYICRPGDDSFQTFDKRGFRYLQLDVRNAPAGFEIGGVELLFSTYPVEAAGAFRSSDDRLNQIWSTGRYTCMLNMEDGYTDCPWRERGQWWGDARVEGLINYYCFGDRELIRKCLRQQAQSLNEEGMTWGVYPTDWDGGRLPSFTLIWVSTLWDYYQYTGDSSLVRELYPKVRYTLDHFFKPRVSAEGLLKDVPYWVFIDWAPVETDGQGASLNAYYYDAMRHAAEMAKLIGAEGAQEYATRAEAVKSAMNKRLWDAEAHAYRDSIQKDGKLSPKISQQANSLCVLFDIAPKAEQARVLDYIYAPEHKGKVVEAGSPYFSYYQLAALFHANRHEQALAYIREKWGRMLDWGATTWWEMWQPGASFCHGWSGGPTYNLSAEVLGVKPLKPGFSQVLIEPHWLGLQYATGIVPTEKGPVRTAWQHDAKTRTAAVRVEVPDNIPAEVAIPATGDVKYNGKTTLPKGVERIDGAPGTTRIRLPAGGKVVIEVRER